MVIDIIYDGINDDLVKEEKDDRGNVVYSEYSDGVWIRTEYDRHNNQIYLEDSTGYWEANIIHNDGNCTYINSCGMYLKGI